MLDFAVVRIVPHPWCLHLMCCLVLLQFSCHWSWSITYFIYLGLSGLCDVFANVWVHLQIIIIARAVITQFLCKSCMVCLIRIKGGKVVKSVLSVSSLMVSKVAVVWFVISMGMIFFPSFSCSCSCTFKRSDLLSCSDHKNYSSQASDLGVWTATPPTNIIFSKFNRSRFSILNHFYFCILCSLVVKFLVNWFGHFPCDCLFVEGYF